MKQSVDQIKIIEYEPRYAAAVAEMWNNSQDGWGGGNSIVTEEQVLKQEAHSSNLHLFLALDGENVVGYCSLGEYREDEGALYIPLLNVRGDYHGRKIGKALVLKALEKAIDMKWPRLDLYTWAGNTKAVPLYKKCGFFWEDRDDSTHLMNFMPTVLHTEAVQDFFREWDWYETSTRQIEVKPDGIKDNDFHYYEYTWSKNGRSLKMAFERTGRGLRSIGTNDYEITATLEDFKLVFGSNYKIRYHIKNKTGKPLTVTFQGEDYKNIKFSYETSVIVEDELTLEAPFYVASVDEEQSTWRTHPTVNTMVTINGKKALFKIGLMPKFPANVTCHVPDDLAFIGNPSLLYIDIENNYQEAATFSFRLPETDGIQLEKTNVEMHLEPKARGSIPIRYTLKKYGFYAPELEVTATRSGAEPTRFTKKIWGAFKGLGAKFTGECEDYYHVYNGPYQMLLDKFNNDLVPRRHRMGRDTFFMYPKLGKPFSEEFSKIKPEKVTFFTNESSAGFQATYQSKAFPAIKLHAVATLYNEGLIKHYYEVENTAASDFDEDLWLKNPIFFTLERAIIPYENQFIEMTDSLGASHEYWNGAALTENWLFSRSSQNSLGICWSSDDRMNFDDWYVYVDHHLGTLKGKASAKTKPIYLSIGAFQDWHTFRAFARRQSVQREVLTDHLEFSVAGGNPFLAEDQVNVRVKDYRAAFFNGSIDIVSNGHHLASQSFTAKDQVKSTNVTVNVSDADMGILSAKLKLDAVATDREAFFMKKGHGSVQTRTVKRADLEVFTCNNGPIEMAVAPDFYATLFSLKANGREWLDTSFPKAHPKSWWNPWPGGMSASLGDVNPNALMKEKSRAEYTTLMDSKGNKWEGLKVIVKLEEHEEYKGFEFHQYFLLLPGLPILCHTTEIIQNSRQFMDKKDWNLYAFFSPSHDRGNGWGDFQRETGDWQKIYGGRGEQELTIDRNVVFGGDDHNEKLQIISDLNEAKLIAYINKEVMMFMQNTIFNAEYRKRFFTIPIFFLVTENVVNDRALSGLKSIRFGGDAL